MAYSRSRTDLDGGFAVTGMQAATYRVLFGEVAPRFQPERPIRTGEDNTLVMEAGFLNVITYGYPDDVLQARIHCLQADWKELPAGAPISHLVQPASLTSTAFVLDPGLDWLVFLSEYGDRTPELRVSFRGGKYQQEIELVLSSLGPESILNERPMPKVSGEATIKVTVRDAEGKPQSARISLWRRQAGGRLIVLDGQTLPGDGELSGLKPGTYELLIESSPGEVAFLPIMGKGTYSLGKGTTTKLSFRAEPAGALKLKLNGVEAHEDMRFGARAIALSSKATVTPLTFKSWWSPKQHSATLSKGRACLCSPLLKPGRYKLELAASSEALELPVQTFEIEAGKTTDVEVQLPDPDRDD